MKDVLLNGNTGRDYKNLSWEADRKICIKDHWLASLGLQSDDSHARIQRGGGGGTGGLEPSPGKLQS